MKLTIVTPKGVLIDEDEIYSVNIPCSFGRLGIMSHHASLLTMVKSGTIFYKRGQDEKIYELRVSDGIAKIENNNLKIILDGNIL